MSQRVKPKRLVVFDKDGVLLDLEGTWLPMVIALAEYLSERVGGIISREALLEAVGVIVKPNSNEGEILPQSIFAMGAFSSMREQWAKITPELKLVFAEDQYKADHVRIRKEHVKGNTIPKGEVKSTLINLKAEGYILAIATNDGKDSTNDNLQDLGIENLFEAIICADSGFGRKPEPEGLLAACNMTGFSPSDAVMVGDTMADWSAADKAQFGTFIAIADTAPELPSYIPSAHATLPTIENILAILNEL